MVTEDQDFRPDRDLARRASRGDEAAWREIYDRTSDQLFALLCYQVGDRDEALDLLQETYLQAHRRLDTYRGEAPLASWLRTIAVRKAIDWKRKAFARFRRTVALTEATGVVAPSTDGMRFESERAALHDALKALSPRQRGALLLRELEGLSFKEIARELGCKESTARVHHTRAREKMQEALGADEGLRPGGLEGQRV